MRPPLTYANVASSIALFLVLTGGAAYALDGSNTVFSDDIVDGEVKTPDITNAAVVTDKLAQAAVTSGKVKNDNLTGGDVADESLTGLDVAFNTLKGADIDESTLGQVPSALFGGVGRWKGGGRCDPENMAFVDCGFVTLNLPRGDQLGPQPRVLINGAVGASHEAGSDEGHGACRLATSLNTALDASQVPVLVTDSTVPQNAPPPSGGTIPLTAVTPPLPGDRPISVDFGVECNEFPLGSIHYHHIQISAVAISPN
jgi:hypothetical protein